MRSPDERLEIVVRAVVRLDLVVVGDIVAVVTRRCCDGHQPDAVDAQPRDVVKLLGQPAQIADPVAVRVVERAYENLVASGGGGGGAGCDGRGAACCAPTPATCSSR